jgi:hypothetical protein
MPEGSSIGDEVAVHRPPDDVYRELLVAGVPAMQRANYQLVSKDDNSVVFGRRYLPRAALQACILVVIVVAMVQSSNGGQATPALALGWIAILTMIFYRRVERLTLDLRPAENGTQVIVVGSISKRARAVLGTLLRGEASAPPDQSRFNSACVKGR